MAKYHVGCDPQDNKIYAGTLNKSETKWLNRSDVTDESLMSVRNHFLVLADKEQTNELGYRWEFEDGTTIFLKVEIKKEDNIKEENNEGE